MVSTSTHSCPTTKKLEALSYHRTPYRGEIPDHSNADALHRVLHVLHTELRVTGGDQALPRQNERARLVEIPG